jgi:repressor LexA
LTERQLEILSAIDRFIAEHKFAPTIREIGDLVGIQSTNGVFDHLEALSTKEVLWRGKGMFRALRITDKGRRVLDLPTTEE